MSRSSLIWGLLLGLTLTAWTLGAELQAAWVPVVVLGLTAVKGQLLIDHYMELAHAPRLMRFAVSGWLVGVLILVAAVGALAA